MAGITYDVIQPNVANVTTNGSTVEVSWKCAETGKDMGRSTAQQQADNSVSGRVATSVKGTVVREIGFGLVNLISSLLGSSAGRVARDATYSATSQYQANVRASSSYNENTKRAAIVQAFRQVEPAFQWNDGKKVFVAK